MYDKRIKIFIIISALFSLACVLRLVQMQLLPSSFVQDEIAQLKNQRGVSYQLKTLRGRILDRKDNVLAVDQPQFQLCINYKLTCFLDKRVQKAHQLAGELKTAAAHKANPSLLDAGKELQEKIEDLERVIEKCTQFGPKHSEIETQIVQINEKIWNVRTFVAWIRAGPDPAILEKYNNINSIPLSEAFADFEKKFPSEDQRLLLTNRVNDLAEMAKDWPLLELRTDDDVFTAQLEFMDVDGVQILPKGQRFYPYGSVASQVIGWVGPATNQEDKELFANDKLSSYLDGEVCGREDGIEYVCETILRGRRGEVIYDIDQEVVSKTETQLGKDIYLTIDIELQKRVEEYLSNGQLNPNYKAPCAAVVIEVATGNILTLVSMPVYDLNQIRVNYTGLAGDPNEPLRNRAINKQYPPGSVIKPLILIAALESGKITPDEIISCPAQKAPTGWPSCWIFNRYSWLGHDNGGPNNAHNATKGSCNVYFSRLADRIEPLVFQQWLFKFGYGHQIPFVTDIYTSNNEQRLSGVAQAKSEESLVRRPVLRSISEGGSANEGGSIENRELRQTQGQISNLPPRTTIKQFDQVPPLTEKERRWFGIGQGNLRVTPLQVANAFAAIARGGVFKPPRLFLDDPNSSKSEIRNPKSEIDLGISPQTLAVVYDGMFAVVNEQGGTAYKEFAHSGLTEQDVKVYGKTGSTEQPDNAWFAGFAADSTNRKIAIAVIVEGGQHGSSDAAPLARDIIQFCIDAGYIGKNKPTIGQKQMASVQ
jgi:penicillin-binding protein 2